MNLLFFSYRFAEEVLGSPAFETLKAEAYDIFRRLPPISVGSPEWDQWRNTRRTGIKKHTVDPDAMNRWLESEFRKAEWEIHPRIVPETRLEGDYRKGRIQIEVQFGNIARYTYDLFKFQVSYSRNEIDVALLVVPVQKFAQTIGSNIAYFERVIRELPNAKLSITLPIMVIGLVPELPAPSVEAI